MNDKKKTEQNQNPYKLPKDAYERKNEQTMSKYEMIEILKGHKDKTDGGDTE